MPDKVLHTPLGAIKLGNAANGLCGGMAFAVRDLFEAGQLPPRTRDHPVPGSPAFEFLVDPLFDSFNLPGRPPVDGGDPDDGLLPSVSVTAAGYQPQSVAITWQ